MNPAVNVLRSKLGRVLTIFFYYTISKFSDIRRISGFVVRFLFAAVFLAAKDKFSSLRFSIVFLQFTKSVFFFNFRRDLAVIGKRGVRGDASLEGRRPTRRT